MDRGRDTGVPTVTWSGRRSGPGRRRGGWRQERGKFDRGGSSVSIRLGFVEYLKRVNFRRLLKGCPNLSSGLRRALRGCW